MVNNWLNIIQDSLLPPTCLLCGNPGKSSRDLCEDCFQSLSGNHFCCYQCAEIFEHKTVLPGLCGHCQKNRPAFDETHAPFVYQETMRFLIKTLKFNAQHKNARLLGTLLAESLTKSPEMPEYIIPVPLHPSRYRERGFNQSIEIAKTVSKLLNIPIDLLSCQRHRATSHQANLPAKQRRKNLRNAFSIRRTLDFSHVAIVDDVMTTGTTVNELAKVLKKAGVGRVDVWVCARA